MSATLAYLEPRLWWAVQQGAISVAEAWTFQDLVLMLPPGMSVELPECLEQMMDRLALLEVPPDNQLPV